MSLPMEVIDRISQSSLLEGNIRNEDEKTRQASASLWQPPLKSHHSITVAHSV